MSDEGIKARRFKRFDRACIVDGESNPALLEQHNVGGLEITICARCWCKLLARRTPRFAPIWTPPTDLESIAHALLDEADALSLLAESRWLIAHALFDRVRRDAPDEQDEGT